jgi:hypothetical protein
MGSRMSSFKEETNKQSWPNQDHRIPVTVQFQQKTDENSQTSAPQITLERQAKESKLNAN